MNRSDTQHPGPAPRLPDGICVWARTIPGVTRVQVQVGDELVYRAVKTVEHSGETASHEQGAAETAREGGEEEEGHPECLPSLHPPTLGPPYRGGR